MLSSKSKADKKQEYLNQYNRLANLFVTDRFAFEQERKRMLNEAMDRMSTNEKHKEQLMAQQKEWDRILNRAGSPENRFSMIQALFWHHIINTWQPNLQEHSTTLKALVRVERNRPAISLVRKKSLTD